MTPAQKVAIDSMREAWAPDVVERMLRHIDAEHERDLCTRTAIRVRSAAERLVAEIQGEAGEAVSMQAFGWLGDTRNRIDAMDVTPHLPPFSPPETSPGASTPRPPGETP